MNLNHDGLLKRIIGLFSVIALLHAIAVLFYIYWTFWWYDVPMHFMGGFWVGLVALWFRERLGFVQRLYTDKRLVAGTVAAAVFVGALWEIWERLMGHSYSVEGYGLDTSVDMVMDILGAVAAAAWYKRSGRKPLL